VPLASAPTGGSATAFVMDVPGHLDPLIITDAAVNIAPTLEEKVDIVQNAIDLAHAVRLPRGPSGNLSAMETINPKVSVHDRSRGAVQDGRSGSDNRRATGRSAGVGQCDQPRGRGHQTHRVTGRWSGETCCSCRNLEAGNMLAKSLSFLAGADTAGIVLGARVPIILTSRADSLLARLASCALASMVAASRKH